MTDMKQKCFLCEKECEVNRNNLERRIYVKCQTCGEYGLTEEASDYVNSEIEKDKKWILSALLRQKTETGNPLLEILTKDIVEMLNTAKIPEYPLDKMNKILLYIHKKTSEFGKSVEIEVETDYPIFFAKSEQELSNMIEALREKGFLKYKNISKNNKTICSCILTMDGIKKIYEIQKSQPENKQCFVAMWFDGSMDDAWKNGFNVAIKETGYDPLRIDLKEHNEKICDAIISEIRKSILLVADITGMRSGVFFEAGFANGLGIPVIWTCREDYKDKIKEHFDTRQYKHIIWTDTKDLNTQLIDRINATVPLEKKSIKYGVNN